MPVYDDPDQFETMFTRLFAQVIEDDPTGLDGLADAGMVICFEVTDPSVELWIDGRSLPVTASVGSSELEADLAARLSGDSLHELLLGTLPLGRALFRRKLKVKGSKSKAMQLEPLLHALQAAYPDIADDYTGD